MLKEEHSVEFIVTRPESKLGMHLFSRYWGFYNLGLPLLAALTPDNFKVKVIDKSVDHINYKSDADLIAMSVMTSHANNAYRIADTFRKNGKIVVMGGIHPTALPEEAIEHADAVAIGEGELIWPEILSDFKNGNLRSFYKADRFYDLSQLPCPKHNLMPRFSKHIGAASLQITRGCPFDCTFCSITSVFGRNYRKRPIPEVIEEINSLDQTFLIMVDDNIVADASYAAELFKALVPLNVKWVAQTDISIARDEELLELASRSGCVGLLIGLESISQNELSQVGKVNNNANEYAVLLKNIHKHRILVSGSFILGLDGQSPSVFEKTVSFARKNGLAYAFLPILTPFPGTNLFEKYRKEGRLLHQNWSQYDCCHVVYKPNGMTEEQLLQGWEWATKEFAGFSSIIERYRITPIQTKTFLITNLATHFYSRFDKIKRHK